MDKEKKEHNEQCKTCRYRDGSAEGWKRNFCEKYAAKPLYVQMEQLICPSYVKDQPDKE